MRGIPGSDDDLTVQTFHSIPTTVDTRDCTTQYLVECPVVHMQCQVKRKCISSCSPLARPAVMQHQSSGKLNAQPVCLRDPLGAMACRG